MYVFRAALRPVNLIFSAAIVLLAVLGGGLVVLQIGYAGRAYPGVSVQGTDVSGMPPEQILLAAQAKSAVFHRPLVTLRVGDLSVTVRPADLGMDIDPAATAQRALDVGRQGDVIQRLLAQVAAWWQGHDVAPVAQIDQAALSRLVSQLAAESWRAPRDAGLQFEGGQVREVAAQPGAELDQARARQLIEAVLAAGQPIDLALPLAAVQPRVASAAPAAADAARITGQELAVLAPRWDDQGNPLPPVEAFRLTGAELAGFLRVEPITATETGGAQLAVRLDRGRFRPMIEPLAATLEQAAQNARFEYDDTSGRLQAIAPGRDERRLDVEATLDAVDTALRQGAAGGSAATAVVAVTIAPPPVGRQATAQQLGITGLITQATTYFKGSSAARLTNIRTAAARFHGIVVPPRAVFSFDEFLGDVSTKEGFEEGLIIVGDRTIKGVGGGVCQVSTTAYQAALRAGFPIVERYPHGYRVSYYERGMGPGFDAAVFSPLVDMRFLNDTGAYLLIETFFDPARATLTFKFYGQPDGRQVAFTDPEVYDVAPHGPDVYEPDPEGKVPAGKVRQVEYAVDGATVRVQRRVTRNGETLINESITSQYQPWQALYQYGPDFTPPEGAEVKTAP